MTSLNANLFRIIWALLNKLYFSGSAEFNKHKPAECSEFGSEVAHNQ